MKVDFLITELNVGGAEKALTELAIGMQEGGHQVRVLSIGSEPSDDPSSNRHGLVDALIDRRIRVEFGGFDHWSRLLSAKRWLTQRMREYRPDVCQTFLFHANCLGTVAAKRAGVRIRVGGLRVAESDRVRCVIERQAVRNMNHLVCVSRQVNAFAIDRLSASDEQCSVIPNGIDISIYRDAKPFDWTQIHWPRKSRVAVFAGRFHHQKGLDLIQQQWTELMGQDSDRRLLLIGDGPLRQSLCEWASDIGQDRVQVLPWQRDVTPYFKAATMLILPSRYEGMPNVVLESMAAGRPVVCSRVEGSEELLGDDSNHSGSGEGVDRNASQGFPVGDGPAMVRLADNFFRDPVLCQRIGDANQHHIETNFPISRMIDRYQSLYQSLLINSSSTET